MKIRHIIGSGLLFDLPSQSVDTYAHTTPRLDLREYFNGSLTASGIFVGLSGHVQRRFTMKMNGHWSGDKGTIEEKFQYDDGESGERCWKFEFADDKNFSATAQDVQGTGQGAQCGHAAVMRYSMNIPRNRGEILLAIEDWFYLNQDGILFNRARLSKFGLKVGEVQASFRKAQP